MKVVDVEDIPDLGLPLQESQVAELSREQDYFYQSLEDEKPAPIASALDRLNTRIWKILTQGLTKASRNSKLFKGSDLNSVLAIGSAVIKICTPSAYEFFQEPHTQAMLVYNRYHSIAKGSSVNKESQALSNDHEWLSKAVENFFLLGEITNTLFNVRPEYNLFISQKKWAITNKYDFLSWTFAKDPYKDTANLIDVFNKLSDEEVSFLSTKSLMAFTDTLAANDEYESAISVLNRVPTQDSEVNFQVQMKLGKIHKNNQRFSLASDSFLVALAETKKSGEFDRRYTQVLGYCILMSIYSGRDLPKDSNIFYEKATSYTPEMVNLLIQIDFARYLQENNTLNVRRMRRRLLDLQNTYLDDHSDFHKASLYESISKSLTEIHDLPMDDECVIFLRKEAYKIYTRHSRWDKLCNLIPDMIESEEKERTKKKYKLELQNSQRELEALDLLIQQSKNTLHNRYELPEGDFEHMQENLKIYFEEARDQNYTYAIEELLSDHNHFGFRLGHGSDWMAVDDYKGDWMKLGRLGTKIRGWRRFSSNEPVNSTLLELVSKIKNLGEKIGTTYSKALALDHATSSIDNYLTHEERIDDLIILLRLHNEEGSHRLATMAKARISISLRHMGEAENAYKLVDEAIEYYSKYYIQNSVWEMEKKANWLFQDRLFEQVLEEIANFKDGNNLSHSLLIMLNSIEAKAMMAQNTPSQLDNAVTILEEIANLILAKKSIMPNHYRNYQGALARLVAAHMVQDNIAKIDELIHLLGESSTFNSSTVMHVALGILRTEQHMNQDSLIPFYFKKADLDLASDNSTLAFISLLSLIRNMERNDNPRTETVFLRVFQMATQNNSYFAVNALLGIVFTTSLKNSIGNLVSIESIDEMFKSCENVKQMADYLQTKTRLTSDLNEKRRYYKEAFELYVEAGYRIKAALCLKHIYELDCPKNNIADFERKLNYDVQNNINTGMLYCLSKTPRDYVFQDEHVIEILDQLANSLEQNSREHEHFLNLVNDKFRNVWRQSPDLCNKKIVLFSKIGDSSYWDYELQARKLLGSAMAYADMGMKIDTIKRTIKGALEILTQYDHAGDWNLFRLFGGTLTSISALYPDLEKSNIEALETVLLAYDASSDKSDELFFLHKSRVEQLSRGSQHQRFLDSILALVEYFASSGKGNRKKSEYVIQKLLENQAQFSSTDLEKINVYIKIIKKKLPSGRGPMVRNIITQFERLRSGNNSIIRERKNESSLGGKVRISFESLDLKSNLDEKGEKASIRLIIDEMEKASSEKTYLMLKSNMSKFGELNLHPTSIMYIYSHLKIRMLEEKRNDTNQINQLHEQIDAFLSKLSPDGIPNRREEIQMNARAALLFCGSVNKWLEKSAKGANGRLEVRKTAKILFESIENKKAFDKLLKTIDSEVNAGRIYYRTAELFHIEGQVEKARRFYGKALMKADEDQDKFASQSNSYRLAQLAYIENEENAIKQFSARFKEMEEESEEFEDTRKHFAIFHLLVTQQSDVARKIFSSVYDVEEITVLLTPAISVKGNVYELKASEDTELIQVPKELIASNLYKRFRKANSLGNGIVVLEHKAGNIHQVHFPAIYRPHLETPK